MSVLDKLYEKARLNPQKVAFPEAANEKMMQAAYETGRDGYIVPVLVGNEAELKELAVQRGYETPVFTIVDIHDEAYKNQLIEAYVNQPGRMLKAKALGRRMENPLYFAMVMQAVGEADVTFAGIDNTTGDIVALAGGVGEHGADLRNRYPRYFHHLLHRSVRHSRLRGKRGEFACGGRQCCLHQPQPRAAGFHRHLRL